MSNAIRLLFYLLSIGRASAPELSQTLADASYAVEHNESLFEGEFGKAKTLLVVIEWIERESAGRKTAVGKDGDCGRMQLLFVPSRQGHSCTELQAPGTLDVELGLQWMLAMKKVCGNVPGALAAYARGRCDHPEGIKIARFRLDEITRAVSK
jgi:hypothetical protein